MMQRPVPAENTAANDNVMLRDRGTARSARDLSPLPIFDAVCDEPIAKPEPFRVGLRPLVVAGFSGFVLVALSGAFLIGLAAVGVFAAAVGSFDLIGRRVWWPLRTLGTLDHQVIGYRP